MLVDQCPSKETLSRFLAGKLTEHDSEQLAGHLSSCSRCDSAAAQLEQEPDSLAAILKARGAISIPTQPHPQNQYAEAYSLWDRLDEVAAVSSFPSAAITGSVGSYDLLEQLGRGGMGTVYLARHRELDKHVAIKLLPSLSAKQEEFVARFRREIRAAGKLDHPSIVKATDAGELEGVHFLVMEVVEGADLSRIIRSIDSISTADACEIIRQAALGLAHAHQQGIVHRDVKPSNLMLNQVGEVKILDFGLAHLFQSDDATTGLTTAGQLMGTLDYMAPEQASPGSVTGVRADVYSLAATLFALLTKLPPLACKARVSPIEKLQVLSRHELRPINELRPNLPSKLVKLIESGLSTDPENRPLSALKFAEELEPFAKDANLQRLSQEAGERIKYSATTTAEYENNHLAQTTTGAGATRRPTAAWIAAALTGLLIVAGGLITLELTKGKLIIDSDAPVTVRIVDDAEQSKELNIQPGVTTTRLRDGKYEISLAAESDRVVLSESTFSIRRGTTEVASVRKVTSDKPPATATVGELRTTPNKMYLTAEPYTTPNAKIYEALASTNYWELDNFPLNTALDEVADALNIPVWMDIDEVESLGFQADTPVSIKLAGQVKVSTALRLLLKPLDLSYTVRNGILEITSMDRADELSVNPGDTLSVFVDGVFPVGTNRGEPPPMWQAGNGAPAPGMPTAVDQDGQLQVPGIGRMNVAGQTLDQIRYNFYRKLEEIGLGDHKFSIALLMTEEIPLEVRRVSSEIVPLGASASIQHEPQSNAMPNGPIQAGDVLAISVPDIIPFALQPSLPVVPVYQAGSRPPVRGELFRVDESGNIQLPLLAELSVADLSLQQLRKLLMRRYVEEQIIAGDRPGTSSVEFLMRAGESLPVTNLTPSGTTKL